MKLPGIDVKGVGEFQKGKIAKPDYMGKSQALAGAVKSAAEVGIIIYKEKNESDFTGAMGDAATELSELRAKLETSRSIPTEEIPDTIIHEMGMTVTDMQGNERDIGKPFTFTHEIADEWWAQKSQEIVDKHAANITDPELKQKFINDIGERYVQSGSLAIGKASIIKSRMHNQATAQESVQALLASNAPTAVREEQAHEILDRQLMMGADPVWVQQQKQMVGPYVDQLDTKNALMNAATQDELDQIVEEMYVGDNRMSVSQMNSLNVTADKRTAEFELRHKEMQRETGDRMFKAMVDGTLTNEQISDEVINDGITREVGTVYYNMINKGGGTVKETRPATLNHYREQIIMLPYTGNNVRMSEKAQLLKRIIIGEVTGLTPQGQPSGKPATITGTEGQLLIKEIDAKLKSVHQGSQAYQRAWESIQAVSGVKDILGAGLDGSQPNVNAALAFKRALDTYMDQFGADADPSGFFQTNRGIFAPENFEDPVNIEFSDAVPIARNYMELDAGGELRFSDAKRREFLGWMKTAQTDGTLDVADADRIGAYFMAFYLGRGQAPVTGLQAPQDSDLYGQFLQ